ncbi:hypothetical protein SVI_1398 [Shewanella violacea DSS12]|uniref:Uncharacterized protein n=1 Tax=Shewanella violacea (strain JCM 10179 / CIP 106290 / LMG 19151 / DSS12) TaxID=637905 RepID=D4ZI70_SHEVD|nr:hypothetical protein SVI_1398 [Shewanella violacea DSS12]
MLKTAQQPSPINKPRKTTRQPQSDNQTIRQSESEVSSESKRLLIGTVTAARPLLATLIFSYQLTIALRLYTT